MMLQGKFLLVGMIVSAALLFLFEKTNRSMSAGELLMTGSILLVCSGIQLIGFWYINWHIGEGLRTKDIATLALGIGLSINLYLVGMLDLFSIFNNRTEGIAILGAIYTILFLLLLLNQRRIRRRNRDMQVEALFAIHMTLSGGYDDWEVSED